MHPTRKAKEFRNGLRSTIIDLAFQSLQILIQSGLCEWPWTNIVIKNTAAHLQGSCKGPTSMSQGCFGIKRWSNALLGRCCYVYIGVWKKWTLWPVLPQLLLQRCDVMLLLKYVFSLYAGEEGVVFSHSVETSHVRAEPFQDLKWVCVCRGGGVRERELGHFSSFLLIF